MPYGTWRLLDQPSGSLSNECKPHKGSDMRGQRPYHHGTLLHRASGHESTSQKNVLEFKHQLNPIQPVVVILRPGIVQLWTEECDECAWSGLRSLYLHRQGVSTGSSMLHPPSGFVYSPEHDAIVLSLFDGTLHVLHDISSSPTVGPSMRSAGQSGFSSSDLSSISRKIFIQLEGGAIPQEEMNRINGMASFGGFPIVCWAHE
jgi:hypothetical protein